MKRISLILLSFALGCAAFFLLTSSLHHIGTNSLLADDETTAYTITELGTLGGTESFAEDINNEGQVIGSSTISDGLSATAFLWETGSMVPLTVTAGLTTSAKAINDAGLIAGYAFTEINSTPFQLPVLWAGGIYTTLETISATQGTAQAANNLGLVAGNSITESSNHLLFWQDGNLTNSVPISAGLGWVGGLNNLGQLVGHIENAQEINSGFLYASGVFTDLGTLGGSSSTALDINDLGQIVGSSNISDDLSTHAFLWVDGQMSDLGVLGDVVTRTSQAKGINSYGLIVGQSQVGDEDHAVLWQDGQILDLNTMLPPESDWDLLQTAESINDAGWIVGTGQINGQRQAFLLQPSLPIAHVYLPIIIVPEASPTPKPTVTPSPTMTPSPTATPVPSGALDMNRFFISDKRILYEVRHSTGSQARHQTHIEGPRFFHTKGNEIKAEWEEMWSASGFIYRGTDTSPGKDELGRERYYSLYASSNPGSPVGSRWIPRYWKVGDIFARNEYVVFRNKANCSVLNSGWAPTWLKFEAYYPQYTFASGITLKNVVQLAWLLSLNGQPEERYYYAEDYGLVGWGSADRGLSYINEIHGPGQRPDNKREVIPCMNQMDQTLSYSPELNDGLLPLEYLKLIK